MCVIMLSFKVTNDALYGKLQIGYNSRISPKRFIWRYGVNGHAIFARMLQISVAMYVIIVFQETHDVSTRASL